MMSETRTSTSSFSVDGASIRDAHTRVYAVVHRHFLVYIQLIQLSQRRRVVESRRPPSTQRLNNRWPCNA